MALWAKIDVDMPQDAKLLGQPVVTRHLWTCLVCLAKKQDDGGSIRGYDCAVLAGAFNLPKKGVAEALTYFGSAKMIELELDGTIRLLNFIKRQGEMSVEEQRAAWRERQEQYRHRRMAVTRDSPVTLSHVTSVTHANVTRLEEEKEKEEEKNKKRSRGTAPTAPVWSAYSSAYRKRYGVPPVRNAKAFAQLAQFIKRIPEPEAPEVAAYYVEHPSAFYVARGHAIGNLLADAEKLRTEWATGKQITATEARQKERTQANGEGWAVMLKGEKLVGDKHGVE